MAAPGEAAGSKGAAAGAAEAAAAAAARAAWLRAAARGAGARSRGSALAELERQQRSSSSSSSSSSSPQRYLTFAQRQALVNSPAPAWLPMLVAFGMICFVSMTLSGLGGEGDLSRGGGERWELPLAAEGALQQQLLQQQLLQQAAAAAADAEPADADPQRPRRSSQLLLASHEQALDWVESKQSLSTLMLRPADYVTLHEAPAQLQQLASLLLQQARDLQQTQRLQPYSHSKLSLLLQQDLIAAAELVLLCRILAARGALDAAQVQRLQQLLQLALQRFGKQWPAAIGLSRYVPSSSDQELYLRLVSAVAAALDDAVRFCLAEAQQSPENAKIDKRKRAWNVLTARFDIQRLLQGAGFPEVVADVFRTE
ncbi:hypothetical protein, conserved [Eimeria tenella]|uniref:Uncharacterized protein n=1 Tax=Eimeria tenella TaxID=5802 RepID=U6KZI0_EIMTE|nr:hypothetical protein, conserved [Eimeria tenella]CDJ42338.1 hypothetical protein, conserved [Eimeria tenella]|eukprot:XP_013233088.1 hypothetical protein, conserved [Eimeria tenella]